MKTLRQVREEKGVTKAAMIRHLGCSRPTYDEYEDHPERMRVETAVKVAEFLGVSVSEIFFVSNCN